MQFDPTVTLGNVITLGFFTVGGWWGIVKIYHSVDKRLSIFEKILEAHTLSLSEHAGKLSAVDQRVVTLVGDLQRLIGRSEVFFRHVRETPTDKA